MPIRLLIQLTIAVLFTLILIGINPDGFYLRTDAFAVDWLCALIFVVSLFASQLVCFQPFKGLPGPKKWIFSLLLSIPAGIFVALLLYSLVFSLVWAAEL
jgi:hypothetical protein